MARGVDDGIPIVEVHLQKLAKAETPGIFADENLGPTGDRSMPEM